MTNPLYRIGDDLNALLNSIADSGGEVTDEMETQLAQLHIALATKADNVVEYVNSQQIFIEAARSKAREFEEIADAIEMRLEKLDEYVDRCLAQLMTDKIEGQFYTIKKRKPSQMLHVADEGLVPIEYIKIPEIKPQVMKAEITKAIKAGAQVPGCALVESKNISIEYKPKKGGK